MTKIKLKIHHVERFHQIYNRFGYKDTFLQLLRDGYNPFFSFGYILLARTVRKIPNLKIEVVRNGLDDICKLGCNRIDSDCLDDDHLPSDFPLKLNNPYTSEELFKIVKKYYDSK